MWEIVEVRAGRWTPTEEQLDQIRVGLKSVGHLNAPVQDGDGARYWVVLDGDAPVGTFTVVQVFAGENGWVAEIGLNFWIPPSARQYRAIDYWGKNYLFVYTGLMCRILTGNAPIRRAVERFGFKQMSEADGVEVWGTLYSDIKWLKGGNSWATPLPQQQESPQVPSF